MYVNENFAEALLYIALMIVTPALWKMSRILLRYVFNRYIAADEIVVVYKRRGMVVETRRIKATGYVVDQLKQLKDRA
ncbi:hypothetical protein FHR87_002157 [Azomonas macrocytogenes]|uniref:Uncharacterized protein n=1 Tax=Azomonas macrocytogenes TaxID=69962 RepID=A0A839T4S7_AZOMA|nr:hypothetical protein [Azomonas macrocytogenes]